MMIEKSVPFNESIAPKKYPFAKMEVGDSLFFKTKKEGRSAAGAAYGFGLRNDMKFIARADGDGTRIWRIK